MENPNDNLSKSKEGTKYFLKLYITGSAPRSISAVNHITEICDNNLRDYELQIIDIYEKPILAKEDQIIAIPTLIKILPPPERRIIGDMTNKEKVLEGIGPI
ncbi:MAG: circadian clock KaiB family protein [Bacteroidota bacterium]